MAHDRHSKVDGLYEKARNILLHEMTEDEQRLVAELAFDNHATLSEGKLTRRKELARRKGNKSECGLTTIPLVCTPGY
jgi:hypothetical protein